MLNKIKDAMASIILEEIKKNLLTKHFYGIFLFTLFLIIIVQRNCI